jgi:hypothetical protein
MKWLPILFLFGAFATTAQCLQGDCVNGSGTFDFGYAVYTGSFKDGKPNGTGTMDYGNGEKYIGGFENGVEHGAGELHKKGVVHNVLYRHGKLESEAKIVGGNAPKIEGCRSGSCYTGNGEMQYPSGNTYVGNFENGLRQGQGKFRFVSGNTFTGTFDRDVPTIGSFYYAREGVTFTGEVNANCEPQTGDYYYPSNEATVSIQNGSITKIVNPRADRLKAEMAEAEEAQKAYPCSRCNGTGISGYSRVSVTNTIENVGFDRYMNGRYTTTTRYGETRFPDICTECGGKGVRTNR